MTDLLARLFASGRIVYLILLLVLVEALLLLVYRARTGRGVPALGLCANLAAGAMLLLALRAALVAEGGTWIGGWLLGALVAHLLDLALRWGR